MKCIQTSLLAQVILSIAFTGTLAATTVSQSGLGSVAHEDSCTVTGPTAAFSSTTPQIFLRFVLAGVRAGEQVTVDWLDPAGKVAASAPYDQLPAAASLCLLTQIPVGGFAPAQSPGNWTVRISANGFVLLNKPFQITGPAAGGLRVTKVEVKEPELILEGEGFNTESIVHLAQYTASGGWTYFAHVFPKSLEPNRITIPISPLKPAEYVVFVKNDHALSPPARFLIATTGGYRMPFPPSEQWIISQPPYGSYSHWGRTQHAYDIAPRSGGCVVAMRGGVVHAFDRGYGQTPNLRIFGNYITVEHDDGEYSHYGHLRTGTFRVRTGERVEQGQALAIAGTSGYSFGVHVHAQVTKSFSISAQSIPFRFEELGRLNGFRGAVQSTNQSPFGSCSAPKRAMPTIITTNGTKPAEQATPPTWTGSVALAAWWSELTPVAPGSKTLEVKIGWDPADRDLDLHLMSPTGRHYGPFADTTGYTAGAGKEKAFQIPNPEPGTWRVSVQAVKGAEPTPFRVYRSATPGTTAWGGARRR